MYYDNWMVGIRPLQVFPGLGRFSSVALDRLVLRDRTLPLRRRRPPLRPNEQVGGVQVSAACRLFVFVPDDAMLQADAIRGLYTAVTTSGIFPLPATRHLASPASVRWIAIPDDDPNLPPHVLRVAANGYRGTLNLAALTKQYRQFQTLQLASSPDTVFNLWSISKS